MYVMAAMVGSVQWVYGATEITPDSYSPAGRIMLIVIAVGICVLWPMVRLSQEPPRRAVLKAVALDAWVVCMPVLMVVWPMIYMAGWPFEVVAAMSTLMCAWIAIASGLLVNALVQRHDWPAPDVDRVDLMQTSGTSGEAGFKAPSFRTRSVWMSLMLVMVLSAPLAGLLIRLRQASIHGGLYASSPPWLDMLSPFTGVLAISGRGFTGPQDFVTATQWLILIGLLLVGLGAWLIAWLRAP